MSDNDIKLSDETIKILKKMHSINQSLFVPAGADHIRTMKETKTLAAFADIEERFPRDFCVYDLGEFISVMNIVEEPILDFSNNRYIVVKSVDDSQKLKYFETSPDLITSYFEQDISLNSDDFSIEVSEQNLKAVMKTASTLRLDYMGFRADGENMYFSAFNRRTDSDDEETNAFTINLGETDLNFDIFYPSEIMTVLDGSTKFTFCNTQQKSRVECGNMTYIMAMEKDSEINH